MRGDFLMKPSGWTWCARSGRGATAQPSAELVTSAHCQWLWNIQGAHIRAEWELQLARPLRGWPGRSSDLGIARFLLHGCIGRSDRCQSDHCRGGGNAQRRNISHLHFFSPYVRDTAYQRCRLDRAQAVTSSLRTHRVRRRRRPTPDQTGGILEFQTAGPYGTSGSRPWAKTGSAPVGPQWYVPGHSGGKMIGGGVTPMSCAPTTTVAAATIAAAAAPSAVRVRRAAARDLLRGSAATGRADFAWAPPAELVLADALELKTVDKNIRA